MAERTMTTRNESNGAGVASPGPTTSRRTFVTLTAMMLILEAAVVVGARVRGGAELVEVDEVVGGYQAVIRITVEMEGSDRPACVVDSVSRFLR